MSAEAQDKEPFYFTELPNGWKVGRFTALEEVGFAHLVTTRQGFDVTGARKDPTTIAQAVQKAMNLPAVAFCKQVHGRKILAPRRGGSAGSGDGLVTADGSMGLMAFAADCPLILAADPVSRAVGVAHASWRGTVMRIAAELVSQFVSRYNSDPQDLVACIGPSAGPCCYEIGQDTLQLVSAGLGLRAQQFVQDREGKTYLDLWAANVDELTQAGVDRANISTASICTICRNDLFPSHRVEGEKAGRFVAVITPA
ncbi:MAG: polyphenol oxidase family protein [Phycisphaerae bacterium]|jgi:YfiH family protein